MDVKSTLIGLAEYSYVKLSLQQQNTLSFLMMIVLTREPSAMNKSHVKSSSSKYHLYLPTMIEVKSSSSNYTLKLIDDWISIGVERENS